MLRRGTNESSSSSLSLSSFLASSSSSSAQLSIRDNASLILFTVALLWIFCSQGLGLWAWLLSWQSVIDLRTTGLIIVTSAVYWGHSLLLLFLEQWSVTRSWILKCKVQSSKPTEGTTGFLKASKQVLFNQIFVSYPIALFWLHLTLKFGDGRFARLTGPLPTTFELLCQFLFFLIVEEIGFYYFHRLLHHPRIYKYIHKQHHEFTSPIGVAAIYAHPVEHIFSNLIPLMAGPSLIGAHMVSIYIWMTIAIITTVNSHCGYKLPLLPSPEFHDWHHLYFNCNYGLLDLLDSLHGTSTHFHQKRPRNGTVAPMRTTEAEIVTVTEIMKSK